MLKIDKLNFEDKKKIFYIFFFPLFFAISLYFLNILNTHGDYQFFRETINEYKKFSFIEIFLNYTYVTEDQFVLYISVEELFRLLIFIAAKFDLNYNLINFIITFFLFQSVILILYNKPFSNFILFLILISNFYFTSIGLASIKNSLAISLFFYSFYFYSKNNNYFFLIFYFLALSISIYITFIYFFIAILRFRDFLDFLKKYKILKILILLLPIFLNSELLLGKLVGYSNDSIDRQNKTLISENLIESLDSKKNLYNSLEQNFEISEFLTKKYMIYLFKITLDFVDKKHSTIIEKPIYINFSIIDIIKFIIFNIIIYFFLNNNYERKFFYIYILLSLSFFLLINFQRQTLILYIIFITILSFLKKNDLQIKHYILIYFVSIYGIIKTILLLFNLFIYNEVY
jgi:hypothetical protein